jgi:hypothetical protein
MAKYIGGVGLEDKKKPGLCRLVKRLVVLLYWSATNWLHCKSSGIRANSYFLLASSSLENITILNVLQALRSFFAG